MDKAAVTLNYYESSDYLIGGGGSSAMMRTAEWVEGESGRRSDEHTRTSSHHRRNDHFFDPHHYFDSQHSPSTTTNKRSKSYDDDDNNKNAHRQRRGEGEEEENDNCGPPPPSSQSNIAKKFSSYSSHTTTTNHYNKDTHHHQHSFPSSRAPSHPLTYQKSSPTTEASSPSEASSTPASPTPVVTLRDAPPPPPPPLHPSSSSASLPAAAAAAATMTTLVTKTPTIMTEEEVTTIAQPPTSRVLIGGGGVPSVTINTGSNVGSGGSNYVRHDKNFPPPPTPTTVPSAAADQPMFGSTTMSEGTTTASSNSSLPDPTRYQQQHYQAKANIATALDADERRNMNSGGNVGTAVYDSGQHIIGNGRPSTADALNLNHATASTLFLLLPTAGGGPAGKGEEENGQRQATAARTETADGSGRAAILSRTPSGGNSTKKGDSAKMLTQDGGSGVPTKKGDAEGPPPPPSDVPYWAGAAGGTTSEYDQAVLQSALQRLLTVNASMVKPQPQQQNNASTAATTVTVTTSTTTAMTATAATAHLNSSNKADGIAAGDAQSGRSEPQYDGARYDAPPLPPPPRQASGSPTRRTPPPPPPPPPASSSAERDTTTDTATTTITSEVVWEIPTPSSLGAPPQHRPPPPPPTNAAPTTATRASDSHAYAYGYDHRRGASTTSTSAADREALFDALLAAQHDHSSGSGGGGNNSNSGSCSGGMSLLERYHARFGDPMPLPSSSSSAGLSSRRQQQQQQPTSSSPTVEQKSSRTTSVTSSSSNNAVAAPRSGAVMDATMAMPSRAPPPQTSDPALDPEGILDSPSPPSPSASPRRKPQSASVGGSGYRECNADTSAALAAADSANSSCRNDAKEATSASSIGEDKFLVSGREGGEGVATSAPQQPFVSPSFLSPRHFVDDPLIASSEQRRRIEQPMVYPHNNSNDGGDDDGDRDRQQAGCNTRQDIDDGAIGGTVSRELFPATAAEVHRKNHRSDHHHARHDDFGHHHNHHHDNHRRQHHPISVEDTNNNNNNNNNNTSSNQRSNSVEFSRCDTSRHHVPRLSSSDGDGEEQQQHGSHHHNANPHRHYDEGSNARICEEENQRRHHNDDDDDDENEMERDIRSHPSSLSSQRPYQPSTRGPSPPPPHPPADVPAEEDKRLLDECLDDALIPSSPSSHQQSSSSSSQPPPHRPPPPLPRPPLHPSTFSDSATAVDNADGEEYYYERNEVSEKAFDSNDDIAVALYPPPRSTVASDRTPEGQRSGKSDGNGSKQPSVPSTAITDTAASPPRSSSRSRETKPMSERDALAASPVTATAVPSSIAASLLRSGGYKVVSPRRSGGTEGGVRTHPPPPALPQHLSRERQHSPRGVITPNRSAGPNYYSPQQQQQSAWERPMWRLTSPRPHLRDPTPPPRNKVSHPQFDIKQLKERKINSSEVSALLQRLSPNRQVQREQHQLDRGKVALPPVALTSSQRERMETMERQRRWTSPPAAAVASHNRSASATRSSPSTARSTLYSNGSNTTINSGGAEAAAATRMPVPPYESVRWSSSLHQTTSATAVAAVVPSTSARSSRRCSSVSDGRYDYRCDDDVDEYGRLRNPSSSAIAAEATTPMKEAVSIATQTPRGMREEDRDKLFNRLYAASPAALAAAAAAAHNGNGNSDDVATTTLSPPATTQQHRHHLATSSPRSASRTATRASCRSSAGEVRVFDKLYNQKDHYEHLRQYGTSAERIRQEEAEAKLLAALTAPLDPLTQQAQEKMVQRLYVEPVNRKMDERRREEFQKRSEEVEQQRQQDRMRSVTPIHEAMYAHLCPPAAVVAVGVSANGEKEWDPSTHIEPNKRSEGVGSSIITNYAVTGLNDRTLSSAKLLAEMSSNNQQNISLRRHPQPRHIDFHRSTSLQSRSNVGQQQFHEKGGSQSPPQAVPTSIASNPPSQYPSSSQVINVRGDDSNANSTAKGGPGGREERGHPLMQDKTREGFGHGYGSEGRVDPFADLDATNEVSVMCQSTEGDESVFAANNCRDGDDGNCHERCQKSCGARGHSTSTTTGAESVTTTASPLLDGATRRRDEEDHVSGANHKDDEALDPLEAQSPLLLGEGQHARQNHSNQQHMNGNSSTITTSTSTTANRATSHVLGSNRIAAAERTAEEAPAAERAPLLAPPSFVPPQLTMQDFMTSSSVLAARLGGSNGYVGDGGDNRASIAVPPITTAAVENEEVPRTTKRGAVTVTALSPKRKPSPSATKTSPSPSSPPTQNIRSSNTIGGGGSGHSSPKIHHYPSSVPKIKAQRARSPSASSPRTPSSTSSSSPRNTVNTNTSQNAAVSGSHRSPKRSPLPSTLKSHHRPTSPAANAEQRQRIVGKEPSSASPISSSPSSAASGAGGIMASTAAFVWPTPSPVDEALDGPDDENAADPTDHAGVTKNNGGGNEAQSEQTEKPRKKLIVAKTTTTTTTVEKHHRHEEGNEAVGTRQAAVTTRPLSPSRLNSRPPSAPVSPSSHANGAMILTGAGGGIRGGGAPSASSLGGAHRNPTAASAMNATISNNASFATTATTINSSNNGGARSGSPSSSAGGSGSGGGGIAPSTGPRLFRGNSNVFEAVRSNSTVRGGGNLSRTNSNCNSPSKGVNSNDNGNENPLSGAEPNRRSIRGRGSSFIGLNSNPSTAATTPTAVGLPPLPMNTDSTTPHAASHAGNDSYGGGVGGGPAAVTISSPTLDPMMMLSATARAATPQSPRQQ